MIEEQTNFISYMSKATNWSTNRVEGVVKWCWDGFIFTCRLYVVFLMKESRGNEKIDFLCLAYLIATLKNSKMLCQTNLENLPNLTAGNALIEIKFCPLSFWKMIFDMLSMHNAQCGSIDQKVKI